MPATGPSPAAPSLYASAMAADEFDSLETPDCPLHPTTRLIVAGTDPQGSDAHWQCPVPDCVYSQLA